LSTFEPAETISLDGPPPLSNQASCSRTRPSIAARPITRHVRLTMAVTAPLSERGILHLKGLVHRKRHSVCLANPRLNANSLPCHELRRLTLSVFRFITR